MNKHMLKRYAGIGSKTVSTKVEQDAYYAVEPDDQIGQDAHGHLAHTGIRKNCLCRPTRCLWASCPCPTWAHTPGHPAPHRGQDAHVSRY